MRIATMILLLGAAAALAACDKKPVEQNIAIDSGVPSNADLANADIEALPADESSETPTNQLETGDDQADVNTGNDSNAE